MYSNKPFFLMKIIILLVLSTITLTISLNNVILLLNFISIVGIIGYLLLITSFINLTLLILLVYASLISLLFLVNGLIWMDCFNYRLWVSGILCLILTSIIRRLFIKNVKECKVNSIYTSLAVDNVWVIDNVFNISLSLHLILYC